MNLLRQILFICIYFLFVTTLIYSQVDLLENKLRLAQSYEQRGDHDKAISIYKELVNAQPWNSQYYEPLNRIYLIKKDYEASKKLFSDLLEKNPKDINLYGRLGSTLFLQGMKEDAYEIWNKALNSFPENNVNYRLIANYAIESRAFDMAIEILSKGRDKTGDYKFFSFDIAYIYSITMKYSAAVDEFAKILLQAPDQLTFIQNRMNRYLNNDIAYKETEERLVNIVNENNNINLKNLLAWVYTQGKKYNHALRILIDIDDQMNTLGSNVFNLASTAFSNNDFLSAAEAYKYILDTYSTSPFFSSARIGYAKSLEKALNANNDDQAFRWSYYFVPSKKDSTGYMEIISSYRDLVNAYPKSEISNEAKYRMGYIYFNEFGDLENALKLFNEVLSEAPLSIYSSSSLIELIKIYVIKNDFISAQKNIKVVLNNKRINENYRNEAEFLNAKISFWNGEFHEADSLLKNILLKSENNYTNDALELSMLLSVMKGDSLNLYNFADADLKAYQLKFDDAKKIFRELSENQSLFFLKDFASLRYAQVSTAENNMPETLKILESISSEDSKNIYADKSLYLQGNIYQFNIKDEKKALYIYEDLLARFPNSIFINNTINLISQLKQNNSDNI